MKETRAEKNYVSEVTFRKWVRAMYDQFLESNAIVQTQNDYTYVYLRSKVGVAKCNPSDKWKENIGIAYAWARCTRQPVYYEKKEYNFKAGEWVYVSTVDSKIRILLKYVDDGIDSYCFKEGRGRLVLIDKNNITDISRAD